MLLLEAVNTQQIHSSTSGNAMILSSDVHVLPEAPVPDTEIKPNDLPSHNGFEHVHAVIPAPLLAEVVDRMPILYQYYTHSISSGVSRNFTTVKNHNNSVRQQRFTSNKIKHFYRRSTSGIIKGADTVHRGEEKIGGYVEKKEENSRRLTVHTEK
ncbi:hypothetical protein KIW84_021743 [Lathyrus oleraceus]|uniref:Uncharacterized protein n=1 Tax=Pisum sativum TaxID=3888 RepID=A0A9D5B5R7_PEA|nr:hypothetical protein KIW84_021743 [Pisum sativum]